MIISMVVLVCLCLCWCVCFNGLLMCLFQWVVNVFVRVVCQSSCSAYVFLSIRCSQWKTRNRIKLNTTITTSKLPKILPTDHQPTLSVSRTTSELETLRYSTFMLSILQGNKLSTGIASERLASELGLSTLLEKL